MLKEEFINISQKYGLVITEIDDYCESMLPMINIKDLDRSESFAEFYEESGEVDVYYGFSFNYKGGKGIEINFDDIDTYDTGEVTEYEKIIKEVMERYNMILPLIKAENVNKKLNDIETDFV